MTITAIETAYKGYRFRSRLEARWAVFFDALGIEWVYEHQGYNLSRCKYLPDFYLPNQNVFIEVKPVSDYTTPKIVYVAGKVSGDWRQTFSLRGHSTTGPDICLEHSPGLHLSNFDSHAYEIVDSCLNGIIKSECVFAWIDTLDTYATFVEVGYAASFNRACYIGVSEKLKQKLIDSGTPFILHTDGECFSDEKSGTHRRHDFWFIETLATKFDWFSEAQQAFDCMIGHINFEQEKCLELSMKNTNAVAIVYGDPLACLDGWRCDIFRDGKITDRQGNFDCLLSNRPIDGVVLARCAEKARSARFEHGQRP